MTTPVTIHPNTITALLSHHIVDLHLSVELGQLNVLIGENIHTLSSGQNITIPKNTFFAYANLSPRQAIVTERVDAPSFTKDIVVHADVDGVIYDVTATPTQQVSHSLYLCLVDMLIRSPVDQKLSA